MQNFAQNFEIIVNIFLDEIKSVYQHTAPAKQAIKQYIGKTRSSLSRYDHHQGVEIPDASLTARFFYETAILHTSTYLLKYFSTQKEQSKKFEWPIENSASIYSWCSFNQNIVQNHLDDLLENFKNLEVSQLALIDICDRLLSRNSERYIGEYYTPLNIVEHLIDISRFDPAELFSGKKLVDPACGGGMILASVALRVVCYAKDNNIDDENILKVLTENIFGYDIQPFAVTLCQTVLFSIIFPLQGDVQNTWRFDNLEIVDPLSHYQRFWTNQSFDYVIGNPPFMSVKKSHIDYIEAYNDVIYGHPNMYVLFLWWSVKSVKENGIVSLLLPQSMLVGQYYKSLRECLRETTRLLNITRMIDRKGLVGDADQQMMAISLRVGVTDDICNEVTLRVTRNGTNIANSPTLLIPDNQVVQNINSATIWIVSEDGLDYEIEDCVRQSSKYLGYYSDLFKISNGGYVWNQNKELLSSVSQKDYIPLVSAASISSFEFEFPYNGSHPTKHRAFSRVVEGLKTNIRSGPSILIQRTTPRKVGRRLICSVPSPSFYQTYDRYFLENHVNSIASMDRTLPKLYGLLGWLNSDLINFIFQLRNGTTQVSLYELRLIPVHLNMLNLIAPIAKAASETTNERKKNNCIEELNEVIFETLRFTETQKQRIKKVLNRKENGSH